MYPSNIMSYPVSNSVCMDLYEQEIWERFHEATNEMILTKAGR